MRGIDLKFAVKMFGYEGFKTWAKWSFLYPIQTWYWMNISHRPYCLNCGWHCKKDCKETKLYTKKDILNHWEKQHKEMNKIERGKNNNCVYCGEEKGTQIIQNPNMEEINRWLVCEDCKEVIANQQLFTMGVHLEDKKIVEEANKKLKEIADRTGKPIFTGEITKTKEGYKSSSITFGDEE